MDLMRLLQAAALVAAASVLGGTARGAPHIPLSDDVVLETLPFRPGDPAQREDRKSTRLNSSH